jgi:hypothetical protein
MTESSKSLLWKGLILFGFIPVLFLPSLGMLHIAVTTNQSGWIWAALLFMLILGALFFTWLKRQRGKQLDNVLFPLLGLCCAAISLTILRSMVAALLAGNATTDKIISTAVPFVTIILAVVYFVRKYKYVKVALQNLFRDADLPEPEEEAPAPVKELTPRALKIRGAVGLGALSLLFLLLLAMIVALTGFPKPFADSAVIRLVHHSMRGPR